MSLELVIQITGIRVSIDIGKIKSSPDTNSRRIPNSVSKISLTLLMVLTTAANASSLFVPFDGSSSPKKYIPRS